MAERRVQLTIRVRAETVRAADAAVRAGEVRSRAEYFEAAALAAMRRAEQDREVAIIRASQRANDGKLYPDEPDDRWADAPDLPDDDWSGLLTEQERAARQAG